MSDVSFNGPESLGGKVSQIEPAPVAVSWHVAGRLDVFATDASSSTLQHWWFDGGWGGPESLGGNVVAPSAVSWGPGRLDVFGIDANSSTLQHWWGKPFPIQ